MYPCVLLFHPIMTGSIVLTTLYMERYMSVRFLGIAF